MAGTLELITEVAEETIEHSVVHGVHLACQVGDPFYTSGCGLVMNPEDERHNTGKPECPICWNIEKCQICGARFTHEN